MPGVIDDNFQGEKGFIIEAPRLPSVHVFV